MASSNICWGIELGAGAVKAVKLQRDGDEVKVLEYAYIPHRRPLCTPELNAAEAERLALGTLVTQFDLNKSQLAISVPGHSAFARFAKLPPVEPKKIPSIVKFEAAQQIPFPTDEVEWDYQTFQSPESPDIEVGIFAMTRQKVMERLALWEDVGLTPDYVSLGPVSLYNAVAWEQQFTEQTPGTVILDIGTTSSDLIIAESGRVWIRTFPIGGHQFTETLVEAFKLSYPKADKLKREAEQSKHARHVLQALRPVFGDVVQEVQRSIGYYQSLHADANLTRMMVYGSTFALPGLRKYLGQQLQLEVIKPEGFNKLDTENASGPIDELVGQMSTAYGCAVQGVGLATINANLMPVSVLRENMWRSKRPWFAAAAVLGIAAGGAAFIQPVSLKLQLKSNPPSQQIDTVAREMNRLRTEWTDIESAWKPNYLAANALRLTEDRSVYPHLYNDLGLILADAKQIAARRINDDGSEGVGFGLDTFQTEYVPEDNGVAGAGNPFGRGVGTGTGTGSDEETKGRHVKVTLYVRTAYQGDAPQLVRDSIQQWLFDNETREGVPYTIDRESVRWSSVEQGTGPQGRGAAPGRGGGGRGDDPAVGAGPMPPAMTPAGGGGGRGGGGGGSGGGGANEQVVPGLSDVQQLAPLTPVEPDQPDAPVKRFRITWDAYIVDKDAQQEGGQA